MNAMLRPLGYVAVIVLGYALKRAGFFGPGDRKMLSRLMINVTLPCAVVQAFEGFTRDARLFAIVGIGLAAALAPLAFAYLTSGGANPRVRAYRMLNAGGSNIGCFAMPLIQAFFGGTGVVVASLFDTGNAIMMTGGSYAMTSTLLRTGDRRESAREIAMKFLSSAPFMTYMVMIALAALGVTLPKAAFELTRPAGQANGFIAMLNVGLMFEPALDRALLRETARLLAIRYAFAAAFALACFFLTPFDIGVRKTLAVLCFSPISSLSPIYTERCGGDAALAGFTNSASIACSLAVMLALSMCL